MLCDLIKSLSLSEPLCHHLSSASMLRGPRSANLTSVTFNSHFTDPRLHLLEKPLYQNSVGMEDADPVLGTPGVGWETHSAAMSGSPGLAGRRIGQQRGRQECPSSPGLVLFRIQQKLWKFRPKNPVLRSHIPLPSILVSPAGQEASCPLLVGPGRFTQSSRPRPTATAVRQNGASLASF